MKNVFLVIFISFSFGVQAQLKEFYNDEGKLVVDTSYQLLDSINIPTYSEFGGIPNELTYSLINNVNYPLHWIDAGISGLVIFELTLNENIESKSLHNLAKITNVKCVENPVKNDTIIVSQLQYLKSFSFIFPGGYEIPTDYKVYIPILFKMEWSEQHKMTKYREGHQLVFECKIIPIITKN
jgi:hypothetical protein